MMSEREQEKVVGEKVIGEKVVDLGAAPRALASTDVRWIARGYWDKYFDWRIYPGVRRMLVAAVVAFVLLVALAVASGAYGGMESVPPAYLTVMFVLGIICVALLVLTGMRMRRDKEDFIDSCVSRWESGKHELPSFDSVIQFVDERSSKSGRW
jgi:hypothetical protein